MRLFFYYNSPLTWHIIASKLNQFYKVFQLNSMRQGAIVKFCQLLNRFILAIYTATREIKEVYIPNGCIVKWMLAKTPSLLWFHWAPNLRSELQWHFCLYASAKIPGKYLLIPRKSGYFSSLSAVTCANSHWRRMGHYVSLWSHWRSLLTSCSLSLSWRALTQLKLRIWRRGHGFPLWLLKLAL